MKTLGLIGGLGPETTVEYYRLIVAAYRERMNGAYPPVIINSVDLQSLIAWMNADQLDKAADYLVDEIRKLENAGAHFGALASNTPHIVFEEIQRRVKLPLISIVEATCQKAQAAGFKAIGLLGTRFTMQARFYPNVFSRAGIKLVVPNDAEQTFIHERYMRELLNNQFKPETRKRIMEIAEELKVREGIEAIILGGTELPLLLRDQDHAGMPLLDTSRIHVDRLLDEMLRP